MHRPILLVIVLAFLAVSCSGGASTRKTEGPPPDPIINIQLQDPAATYQVEDPITLYAQMKNLTNVHQKPVFYLLVDGKKRLGPFYERFTIRQTRSSAINIHPHSFKKSGAYQLQLEAYPGLYHSKLEPLPIAGKLDTSVTIID